MSVPVLQLGDLVWAHYGKALKQEDRDPTGSAVVYGSSGEVGRHWEALTQQPTIVVGRKGSVGAITFAPDGGWVIDTAYFLERKNPDELDLRYLFHALRCVDLAKDTITTSIPGLNRDDLLANVIRVPKIDEQRHIAAMLDKVDSLRRKRQEAIRLVDEFLKAVFFERFAEKPRSKVLTDYCDFLAGFAFKSDQYIEPRDGVRLLRGINVGIDRFEWGESAGYPLTAVSDLARYRLEQGDVVLAMDRPWISTGLKCAAVDERVAGSYLVQRVARLRPKQQGTSAFIMNCLRGNEFKSHCRITETTIPHISPKDFSTFPVPTATDAELRSFAEIAIKIQRITSRAEHAVISSDELMSSLQATIFNMH